MEVIPKEQYEEVKDILPGGTSYAKLAFDNREEKLQILKGKKLGKESEAQEEIPRKEVKATRGAELKQESRKIEL